MSDAVQRLIDYCLRAQEQDLYVSLLGNGNAFLYNLKGLARAAQEQLTQTPENVSKPEIANADATKTLRDEMAMAALTGIIAGMGTTVSYTTSRAKRAYALADEMMEARRQK